MAIDEMDVDLISLEPPSGDALSASRGANFAAALLSHGPSPSPPAVPHSRPRGSRIATVGRDQCRICAYSGPRPAGGKNAAAAFHALYGGGGGGPGTPRRDTPSSDCKLLCGKCFEADKAVRLVADAGWKVVNGSAHG